VPRLAYESAQTLSWAACSADGCYCACCAAQALGAGLDIQARLHERQKENENILRENERISKGVDVAILMDCTGSMVGFPSIIVTQGATYCLPAGYPGQQRGGTTGFHMHGAIDTTLFPIGVAGCRATTLRP
jgi:hypothetical protein